MIAIGSVRNRIDPIRMTIQALGRYRPTEMKVLGLVAWSQVPSVLLSEPANGRLEQVTVMVEKVRPSSSSGAEGELDLGFRFDEELARCIPASFAVEYLLSPAFGLIVELLGIERIVGRRVVAF